MQEIKMKSMKTIKLEEGLREIRAALHCRLNGTILSDRSMLSHYQSTIITLLLANLFHF